MAYVALYRKWRPQTFKEVVGQDFVVQTLSNAITSGNIGHAYLFTGPRGSGKTSVARILAKAINCQAGPTPEPDNTCKSCLSITEGNSLDVVEIDAASHTGVDNIRELRESAVFSPAASRKKIYIIDEVHMLSTAAFNALLKTLEEPPEHVIFALCTTEPQKVPKTILSRCQRFDFRRVEVPILKGHLQRIVEEERHRVEPACLALIARYAHGSVRDALVSLEQLVSYSGGEATLADCTQLLQMVETELLLRLSQLMATADVTGVLRLVRELVEGGKDLQQFVRDAIDHFRLIFLLQHVEEGREFAEVEEETYGLLKEQARALEPRATLRAIEVLAQTATDMKQTEHPQILLEMALARICRPELEAGPGLFEGRLERLERTVRELAGEPVAPLEQREAEPARDARPPEPAPQPRVSISGDGDIETIKRSWSTLMEQVKKRKRTTHALLMEGMPSSLTGGKLVIRFHERSAFHALEVKKESHRDVIEGALREVFGHDIGLETVVEGEPPASHHAKMEAEGEPPEPVVAPREDAAVAEPEEPEPAAKKASKKSEKGERESQPAPEAPRQQPRPAGPPKEHSHLKMAKDIFGAEIIEVISLEEQVE
ncbi:MAG: DNA polymerase III subunit gamma/tau [Candidatus Geothermincolia bacterium]